jgi:ketosteroid isomerase-like protein
MADSDRRETIEKLIAGLNRGDVSVLDEVFHEDALMDWPQFSERIRGAENRRRVYANIPTLPRITTRRIFGEGDLWIAEASLDYGEGAIYSTVLIFEFRGDKIARETAYWATPAPPAEWRAAWVEPLPKAEEE